MHMPEPRETQAPLQARAPDAAGPRRADPDALQAARRLYIKRQDMIDYRFTDGCPKCQHARRYGFNRTTANHNNRCYQRMLEEIGKTEAECKRIAKMESRLVEHAAEEGERILQEQQRSHESVGEIGGDRPRGNKTADGVPRVGARVPPPPSSCPRQPPQYMPG